MTGRVRIPSAASAVILSMCLPNRTVVTRIAYGSEASQTQPGSSPVATKKVPATMSGPHTTNTPGSPRPMCLSRIGGAT